MTFAKLSNRKAQIIRYVCRRDRLKSNFTRRQVRKKVAGVAAIVVNRNSIISLSRERIVKLRDKGTVSMWHEGFLNCVINSRGSHAGNNAQQIASLFSRSPQAGRAKNLPSHYDLLLIIGGTVQRHALHLLSGRPRPARRDLSARSSTQAGRY